MIYEKLYKTLKNNILNRKNVLRNLKLIDIAFYYVLSAFPLYFLFFSSLWKKNMKVYLISTAIIFFPVEGLERKKQNKKKQTKKLGFFLNGKSSSSRCVRTQIRKCAYKTLWHIIQPIVNITHTHTHHIVYIHKHTHHTFSRWTDKFSIVIIKNNIQSCIGQILNI